MVFWIVESPESLTRKMCREGKSWETVLYSAQKRSEVSPTMEVIRFETNRPVGERWSLNRAKNS
jgi:hypothetical protein